MYLEFCDGEIVSCRFIAGRGWGAVDVGWVVVVLRGAELQKVDPYPFHDNPLREKSLHSGLTIIIELTNYSILSRYSTLTLSQGTKNIRNYVLT